MRYSLEIFSSLIEFIVMYDLLSTVLDQKVTIYIENVILVNHWQASTVILFHQLF